MVWIEIFNAFLPVIGIALIVLIANNRGKPVDWVKFHRERKKDWIDELINPKK
jgi:hypothetical protein